MNELILSQGFDLGGFQKGLISWTSENARSFPWRHTKNPYRVLIAETFLHRTQAKQVEPVYLKFLEKFPDIRALAEAKEDEVRKIIFPLGLAWRVELLHSMAKEIQEKYNGIVPTEKNELMSLPGVGDYIASSVRCFAYGQPDAIIDTNVMRVITRVFDIPFRDSLRRNAKFRSLAQDMVSHEQSRLYNLGMLDLAFLICKPKSPDCPHCPVRAYCITGRKALNLQ